MITRWILPPPQYTRFITDQDGSLHIECGQGGEPPVIAYLREQLNAWEDTVNAAPIPVTRAPRLQRQGHAGRTDGPGSVIRASHPLGAFSGGTGPIPTSHGPTPQYGPPAAMQQGPTVNGAPFVNPNAAPPPGFAYGVVPPESQVAPGGRPDMLKFGWGNGDQQVMPDPSAPGAAAMTNLNPVPGVCAECNRLAIACDAQPNGCPAAADRVLYRAAEAERAAARKATVTQVAVNATAETNGTPVPAPTPPAAE